MDGMLEHVCFIEERSPQIIEEYRSKLQERVQELLGDATVDESRLLTEVTIFADKVCVDEELVRLRSHIETMKQELIDGGSIGRKLDFIAQEIIVKRIPFCPRPMIWRFQSWNRAKDRNREGS